MFKHIIQLLLLLLREGSALNQIVSIYQLAWFLDITISRDMVSHLRTVSSVFWMDSSGSGDSTSRGQRKIQEEDWHWNCFRQWCGLRTSVLGQDWSETKQIGLDLVCCGLGLGLAGLVLCLKHGLVTLVIIMILKDTATLQVLFIVSLFCAWNTVEINSGVHLLKVKSAKCLCLLPVVLVLLFWSWSCKQRSWS